jgi:serine protease Do
MSDAYSNPPGNPQFPPQSLPPLAPYGPDPREGQGGGFRLSRAIGLLILLLLLWIMPSVVEQVRFAWARGKERAEAEVARQLLDEGRGPTIGQYRTVVKAVQSSVVGVKASRAVGGQDNDELSGFLFGPGHVLREQDQGSGVIVDAAGFIITNYHVVDRATDVRVELSDGETLRATIVGIDPATDLAVLKINGADLKAAPWGKSSEMEVGDPVLAIGSPFGLSRTVTAGILSATGRHAVVEHVNYQDFLQTDAAVNPGNSGGPLVNMHGEIIGINTAIVGPTYQGISFAIPSDMVHDVYKQLLASGKVAHRMGWLGVQMGELTAREVEKLGESGVKATEVVGGSPAAEAGIQHGDVITKFNGKRINGRAELGLAVAWSKIGEKAKVTVRRGEETKEISVDIGQRPEKLP